MSEIVIVTAENSAKLLSENSKIKCEVLVCMPDIKLNSGQIEANTAIICGDKEHLDYNQIKCKQLITYGMSGKNTLTPSSISEENSMLSVQRTIKKRDGTDISIGEFKVNQKVDLENIAITALNLILD